MTVVTVLPAAEKVAAKPSRSMTYPLRDASAFGGKPRQKPKKGEPFDPEELSRRLTAHLQDQKIRKEKRRADRAAKVELDENDGVYRHVPKVAAAAFERTTTPADSRKNIHKLSQPALKVPLKSRMDDLPVSRAVAVKPFKPTTSLRKSQAIDKAMLEKELLSHRNQFQWNQDMEDAAKADKERKIIKPPTRTFNDEIANVKERHSKRVSRPISMGEMVWDELESPVHPPKPKKELPIITPNDRPDWVERDAETEIKKKNRTSPILKKMESSWLLMGRKEKGFKHDEAVAGIGDLGSPPDSKFAKGRFLARFKRHASPN